MPEVLMCLPVLLIATVLTASGVAKLLHRGSLAEWEALGVPRTLRRPLLIALHPWGELLLAVAMFTTGGVLGLGAAVVTAVLMAVYLVLVMKAWLTNPDAECACFGVSQTITTVTVARNVWLFALAMFAVFSAWHLPLIGGASAGLVSAGWWWPVAFIAVALTVALMLWPAPQPRELASAEHPAAEGTLDDYIPSITPALSVQMSDGTAVNLRQLSMSEPTLLVAVRSGCAPCEQLKTHIPEWRSRLPELTIRLLFEEAPVEGVTGEFAAPMSLHDTERVVSSSFGGWRKPSAVLLGGNGLVSGGPVTGLPEVLAFFEAIEQSLRER